MKLVAAMDHLSERMDVGTNQNGELEALLMRVLMHAMWQGRWARGRVRLVEVEDKLASRFVDVTEENIKKYLQQRRGTSVTDKPALDAFLRLRRGQNVIDVDGKEIE